MSIQKINPRTLVLVITILAVAVLRIASLSAGNSLPEWINFTPIGAMALYGGAYIKDPLKSFALPLLTLFISDLILAFTIYAPFRSGLLYTGWYWTYLAFALMVLVGKLLLKNISTSGVILSVVITTTIHWLVSDIGGCLVNDTPSFAVYTQRLIAAIPYELRFLAGTAIYSALMFGSFEWLKNRRPGLKLA